MSGAMRLFKKQVSDTELRDLIHDSFGVCLNANNFFDYASADMVIVDPEDLWWVCKLTEKFGATGRNAAMAKIAGRDPIKPYQTDVFRAAMAYLEELNPEVVSEH